MTPATRLAVFEAMAMLRTHHPKPGSNAAADASRTAFEAIAKEGVKAWMVYCSKGPAIFLDKERAEAYARQQQGILEALV